MTHPDTLVQDPPRFLSKEACRDIVQQIRKFSNQAKNPQIVIQSRWRGDIRWARNRATHASDWRDTQFSLINRFAGQQRQVTTQTNQTDAQSLQSAVRWTEYLFRLGYDSNTRGIPAELGIQPVSFVYPETAIWSDATYAQSPSDRNDTVGALVTSAESAGMLSAGYVAAEAIGTFYNDDYDELTLYAPQTIAQCSLTVRDPEGSGSGWAGASSYDWKRFDPQRLATIALDKCLRSRNPVAIEPGRYTLILEPQAVHGLVDVLMSYIGRVGNEKPDGPFYLRTDVMDTDPIFDTQKIPVTKIGVKIMDERVTISHDPKDPDLGVIPFWGTGEPRVASTWIENGILKKLAYNRKYALEKFHENLGADNNGAYRMSGGHASIDEMIATTKRGLIVTRFSKIQLLDQKSLLCTGVTRDGLWLIENGKISKAVKNLRFTESPLFVLNQIEQLGIPVPVFSPYRPIILPPLKVRDFSFTSLVDAV